MVRGQWENLARRPGLHPYSFSKDSLRFLMTTEIQDLGLTSHPKDIVLPTMQFPRVSQNSKAPYPIGCSHGNTQHQASTKNGGIRLL